MPMCRREVKRLQMCAESNIPEQHSSMPVHVLDIGTGTGLLAMMAARWVQTISGSW